MYGNGFLSPGFSNRHEILHGGSATSQTVLLPFWGDNPRDGRVLGVNRGRMAGYASCWSTCYLLKAVTRLATQLSHNSGSSDTLGNLLELLFLLEIYCKITKSPGNFLVYFARLSLILVTILVFQSVSVQNRFATLRPPSCKINMTS